MSQIEIRRLERRAVQARRRLRLSFDVVEQRAELLLLQARTTARLAAAFALGFTLAMTLSVLRHSTRSVRAPRSLLLRLLAVH